MEITFNNKLCPVCGYDFFSKFGFNPWNNNSPSDEMCPSCGIQFGYDDMAGGDSGKRQKIYKDWREKWIIQNCQWYSKGMKEPVNWQPRKQLENIGIKI